MQRVFSLLAIFFIAISVTMISFDADARRFGGGRSFGKAPSHASRQIAPNNKPATKPAAAPNKGWMGPLGGLIAGGLLASLLMGGGFSGINFFDIIILALLAFFAIRFIRNKLQPQANLGSQHSFQEHGHLTKTMFDAPQNSVASSIINAPAWFNETAFINVAREHFMALQGHWDLNEMDKIAEYVTPEMLVFLKQERANAGEGFQSTYIDNLNVMLEGVDNNPDKTIATLTFTGIAKTSRFDEGEAFNESWRMEREHGENKPWLIAGIRQNI